MPTGSERRDVRRAIPSRTEIAALFARYRAEAAKLPTPRFAPERSATKPTTRDRARNTSSAGR